MSGSERMDESRGVLVNYEQIPGDVLYEYPGDVVPHPTVRLIRVLRVIRPDGEFGYLLVMGEWGEGYDEERFARREVAVLAAGAEALGDEQGPRDLGVLEREYRIERRDV